MFTNDSRQPQPLVLSWRSCLARWQPRRPTRPRTQTRTRNLTETRTRTRTRTLTLAAPRRPTATRPRMWAASRRRPHSTRRFAASTSSAGTLAASSTPIVPRMTRPRRLLPPLRSRFPQREPKTCRRPVRPPLKRSAASAPNRRFRPPRRTRSRQEAVPRHRTRGVRVAGTSIR